MEKILTQDEIDALFRAAQKGQIPGGDATGPQRIVAKFNAREASACLRFILTQPLHPFALLGFPS